MTIGKWSLISATNTSALMLCLVSSINEVLLNMLSTNAAELIERQVVMIGENTQV